MSWNFPLILMRERERIDFTQYHHYSPSIDIKVIYEKKIEIN